MQTRFPNLEAVHSSPVESAAPPRLEKRRLPRLSLSTEQFRSARTGKLFPVADVSAGGFALRILDPNDHLLYPVGARVEGTLNLRGEKHAVVAKVRNVSRDRVGCEFEERAAPFVAALERFLDPAELGRALRPLPAVEAGALWYLGPSNTHLMFWRGADGAWRRFVAVVLGNSIQWEADGGVTTGVMISAFEPDEVRGVVRLETLLFDADETPDPLKLQVAKTLLISSNLPKDLVSWCCRQLRFD